MISTNEWSILNRWMNYDEECCEISVTQFVMMKMLKWNVCWRMLWWRMLWNICHSIVVMKYLESMLWNICHSIVVMKYCFIVCWNEIWNECWNKCCDEDLHSMKCLNSLLDRFSKIIWCDEEMFHNLHQVCNVCTNFIRSFLKNNSMKMWWNIFSIFE